MDTLVQEAYFSGSMLEKQAHFHDCHQIILITKGEVAFQVGHRAYLARAGTVMLISRYENHAIRVQSREYERFVLHISPSASAMDDRVYSLLSNRPEGFQNAVDVSDCMEEFERLLRHILEEHAHGRRLAVDMQQLLVSQLLILIYRQLPETPYFDETVCEVQRQFENHCSRPYTLETLARQYNMSVSALSHRFRAAAGMSVMEYLLSCRMAHAKQMLARTEQPIGEIVAACGFSDSSNFSRTFRCRNGCSPTAFRKQKKAR